ncbi:MAG: formyltetrahydrofolate deformylase [Actinomycetota bacterium]
MTDAPDHGSDPDLHRIVATVRAPDGPGLVAEIAGAAAATGGNIIDFQQISDPYTEEFGCRLVIEGACHTACVAGILEPLGGTRGVTFELHPDEPPADVVVCCSSTLHCVSDLIARVTAGDLRCRITAVISDKDAARSLVEAAGIEFVHLPVDGERSAQEAALGSALAAHDPDLVVLARYMRILPAWLVDRYAGRMINIHHSTLPAFPGANPRRRAHEAGVKVVGATAHYVTATLDEGPIIEQGIVHVGNADLDELIRQGEDVERMTLARAVRLHLEHRIMVFGRRTSVFD